MVSRVSALPLSHSSLLLPPASCAHPSILCTATGKVGGWPGASAPSQGPASSSGLTDPSLCLMWAQKTEAKWREGAHHSWTRCWCIASTSLAHTTWERLTDCRAGSSRSPSGGSTLWAGMGFFRAGQDSASLRKLLSGDHQWVTNLSAAHRRERLS